MLAASLGDITEKVESRRFWPSDGETLDQSTPKTLARCVSGHRLPDEFRSDTKHPNLSRQLDQNSGTIINPCSWLLGFKPGEQTLNAIIADAGQRIPKKHMVCLILRANETLLMRARNPQTLNILFQSAVKMAKKEKTPKREHSLQL